MLLVTEIAWSYVLSSFASWWKRKVEVEKAHPKENKNKKQKQQKRVYQGTKISARVEHLWHPFASFILSWNVANAQVARLPSPQNKRRVPSVPTFDYWQAYVNGPHRPQGKNINKSFLFLPELEKDMASGEISHLAKINK